MEYLIEVLDSLPYGIVVTDADLHLVSVNTWLFEKLGDYWRSEGGASLTRADLTGRDLMDILNIADRPRWEHITRQLLSGEKLVHQEDIAFNGSDQVRWLNFHATALHASAGKAPRLVFSTQDNTDGRRMENQLRSVNFRLESLVTSVNLMNELQMDVSLMIELVVYLIADLYEAECVQYFILDDRNSRIEKCIVEDRSQRGLGRLRPDYSWLQHLIEEWGIAGFIEGAHFIPDPYSSSLSPAGPAEPERILYSLVSTRKSVIGGVLVYSAHTSSLIEQDQMSVLGAITQQLGLYLENAALYAEQQRLAVTDSLTGLINRRRLDEELVKEVKRSDRFQRPVSVLMLDIDNFKRVNDTFGHPAGDRILKHLAQILMIELRTTDIVARYGGEEFLIILPETDETTAVVIAERLRKRIMSDGADPIRHMAPEIIVTISIGIAGVPTHANTPESIVQTADHALYRAKHEGKNRVVVALPPAS